MSAIRQTFLDGRVTLHCGDCIDVLAAMPENSVDSVVCDPPYGLEFMGKEWDAPWQTSSSSALFGKRQTKIPGWGTTRNANCRGCGGRLRGAKKCHCAEPQWDESPNATLARQMSAFQDWCQEWAEQLLRVLKPGGHLLAFGGTRTFHRMACAVEDAGFEIRDQIGWLYGSGFPKSHDVSKGIDKAAGAVREVVGKREVTGRLAAMSAQSATHPSGNKENYWSGDILGEPATDAAREWQGWGTALKPAWEPICLARKPLVGTVAANVLEHGTGALNIDGCRIGEFVNTTPPGTDRFNARAHELGYRPNAYGRDGEASAGKRYTDEGATNFAALPGPRGGDSKGRWPANVLHDGSDEVLAGFPDSGNASGGPKLATRARNKGWCNASPGDGVAAIDNFGDSGSAARFFYSAKADADDRIGSKHPTVKPVDLIAYLCRLITPPGGTVLDCFAGTGTTGEAAWREGFKAILIEREPEYQADIARRMDLVLKPTKRAAVAKTKNNLQGAEGTPLFGGEAA